MAKKETLEEELERERTRTIKPVSGLGFKEMSKSELKSHHEKLNRKSLPYIESPNLGKVMKPGRSYDDAPHKGLKEHEHPYWGQPKK